VEFLVDGALAATDTTSPYSFSWNTTAVANGAHTLSSRAFDAAGNQGTSAGVGVTVNNTSGGTAVYDSTLRAPKCAAVGASCDTGASLVLGRGNLGPEPNQPNTINSACVDGNSGVFHTDESVDRVKVLTVDGTNFAPGKQVRIEATVWAYSSFTSDFLDLYYAADATAPVWTFIGTLQPAGANAQTLTATYTLPTGGSLQAVRAAFRYSGTAGSCTSGTYDDRDDLVFAVGAGTPDTTPPTVTLTAPANGATVSGTITLSANASDNVGVTRVEFYVDGVLRGTDTTSPYSISWNTATVANGAHSVTAKAFDAAGNSATSAAANITVNNTAGQELIVNGGFEGSASPWTLSGTSSWTGTGAYPHGGTGYVMLGVSDNAASAVYQQISIPAGTSPTYTFWLNITTNESPGTAYDFLYAEVRNTAGTLLGTLATYSNLNSGTAGVYSQKTFNLGAYAGQTVRIQFRSTTDVSLPSTFRIDDVSVK